MEAGSIPNIHIQNIGTKGQPQRVLRGFIQLPCWTGYFLADQPNYLIKTTVVTDGRIDLWVDGGINGDGTFFIDPEQQHAYFFLVEHAKAVKQSILQELRNEFPRLIADEYPSWDHEEGGFPGLSDLTPDFDFKQYIGPSSISIEEHKKEGVAYVRWQFRCLWDPEHGFEVITHKNRVIDLGPEADIFKINKDNGTYEALEKEPDGPIWKKRVKRSWWRFW